MDMNFEFIKRIPGIPDQIFRSKPAPEPPKKAGKIVKKKSAAKDETKAKRELKKVPETRKPSKKNEDESESESSSNDDDEEQEDEEEDDGYIPNSKGLKQDSGMNFDWQGMYADIQKKAEE